MLEDDPPPEGDWICPDCKSALKAGRQCAPARHRTDNVGTPKRTIDIAPPLLCVRPDCILRYVPLKSTLKRSQLTLYRLKQRIVKKEDDEYHYVVERLIG
jgi:hypothetical protein